MGRALQIEFLRAGFTDSSGNPLASGKLYSYEAGTSTAKLLYTNQAKTANATNPVILDAQGRAEIFGEGAYKFVIKDSNDVTLYTWDNLQYVYPDAFSVYAGTSTGSANAYVLAPSPALTAYTDGLSVTFVANFATTGAATVNISGLGAKSLVKVDGTTALGVGDILSGQLCNIQFIASSNHFRLIGSAGVTPVSGGGTGASTAADARANLGLGTIATQNANNVSITGGAISGASLNSSSATITGGAISGITDLAVADGGTGASTAAAARSNLSAAVTGANGDITSLTALTAITMTATGSTIFTDTSDGSDTKAIQIGHASATRGAYAFWCGNEHGSAPGALEAVAGAVTGGYLALKTIAAEALRMFTNNTERWGVLSTGHLEPFVDDTYEVGSSSKALKNIWPKRRSWTSTITAGVSINSSTLYHATYERIGKRINFELAFVVNLASAASAFSASIPSTAATLSAQTQGGGCLGGISTGVYGACWSIAAGATTIDFYRGDNANWPSGTSLNIRLNGHYIEA